MEHRLPWSDGAGRCADRDVPRLAAAVSAGAVSRMRAGRGARLASNVPGLGAIESNSRQYRLVANRAWAGRFPDIFKIRDGSMDASRLTGKRLGAV